MMPPESHPSKSPPSGPAAVSAIGALIGKVFKWLAIIIAVLALLIALFLWLFDWNMLRGPIGRLASQATGRTVELRGDLNVHPFSFTPSAEVRGLRISQPDWSDSKDDMVDIAEIDVALALWPLLKGEVILPWLRIDNGDVNLARQADGKANWSFDNGQPKSNEGLTLPVIQQLDLNRSTLRYDDAKLNISLVATVNSSESTSSTTARPFRIDGRGTINNAPFRLEASGGSLLELAERDQVYPFRAELDAGATRIVADGRMPQAFDFRNFTTKLTVQGPDLANLYLVTGLALPNTPPYRLSGTLQRKGSLFDITRFDGKVGDSDLGGTLSVETDRVRPLLKADLHSRVLDFDDLGTLVGAAPDTTETASAGQKTEARQLAANARLLPDAPLDVERVRNMDAEVSYKAQSIDASGLPLRDVTLALSLDDALLKINPVTFTFPQGQLRADITINARNDVPQVDVDARLRDIQLANFLPERFRSGQPALEGRALARAQLSGSGDSVRKAAATANGQITFVIPRGQVRQAFAELAGVNVARGLGLLLTGNQSQTELRCGIASFQATNGILRSRRMVVDTDVTRVNGEGAISLRDETLNLRFKGEPKEFRLLSANVPVDIGGRLRAPKVVPELGPLALQGGLAVAASTVLTPLAAILPFVDVGLADNANCGALMSEARGQGKVQGNLPATPTPAP